MASFLNSLRTLVPRVAKRQLSAAAHGEAAAVRRVTGPSKEQLLMLFGKEGLPKSLPSRGHDNSRWTIATFLTIPACVWAAYNAYVAEGEHYAAHPHGQELPEWLATGNHRKDFFWGDGKTALFDYLIPFESKQRLKAFLYPHVKADADRKLAIAAASGAADEEEEEDDD